jgi:hypothetical protein
LLAEGLQMFKKMLKMLRWWIGNSIRNVSMEMTIKY